jgi:hypothetical protein
MASQSERQSYGSHSSDAASLELFDSVKQLAEGGLDKKLLTYEELLFRLRRWWCHHYKRPYKDPLLDDYTFEELAFEYFDITAERNTKTLEEKVSEEAETEDRAWAEEEEARELAAAEAEEVKAAELTDIAALESDTIVEEAVSVSDEQWANKILENPSADDVDNEGGDISASFEG